MFALALEWFLSIFEPISSDANTDNTDQPVLDPEAFEWNFRRKCLKSFVNILISANGHGQVALAKLAAVC